MTKYQDIYVSGELLLDSRFSKEEIEALLPEGSSLLVAVLYIGVAVRQLFTEHVAIERVLPNVSYRIRVLYRPAVPDGKPL